MSAILALEALKATCNGDGHTLWSVKFVQGEFDRLGIPLQVTGWTIDREFASALESTGGYATVGERVISGEGIVSLLAHWSGVDIASAERYEGRGTRQRAQELCIAQAALLEPCQDPTTCPHRLGDTCPHHPAIEREG